MAGWARAGSSPDRCSVASGSRSTNRLPCPGSLSARDRAAEYGRDPLDDGQTQADARLTAPACFRRAIERLEDVGQVLGRQAESVVLHGQCHDILPRGRAATRIGVPGGLYLQALSSRLSSNWPRSCGWTRTHAGGSSRQISCEDRAPARGSASRAGARGPREPARSAPGRAVPASVSARAMNSSDSTIWQSRTASPWTSSRTR